VLVGPVTTEERAAFAAARPVFEKHCFRCHTKNGRKAKPKSLAHLTLDRYPLGGHHAAEAGTVVRRVLGAGPEKKPPTMPSDDVGAVAADDLAKILAWADAFDRAHPSKTPAAAAHHH
jgi:mono/diheme cytochrome c family protein